MKRNQKCWDSPLTISFFFSMNKVSFDGPLCAESVVLQSVFRYLIDSCDLVEFETNHYRRLMRQLNKALRQETTRLSEYTATLLYDTHILNSLYPMVTYECKLFTEMDKWLFVNNKNILPHQVLKKKKTVRIFENHRPLHCFHSSTTHCLIRKYCMNEKQLKTTRLCEQLHLDPLVTASAFSRAYDRHRYNRKYTRQLCLFYSYYVYSNLHRNNYTNQSITHNTRLTAVLNELKSRVKRCEFPTCSHVFAQPRHRWAPLCTHHAKRWRAHFQQMIRPSTFELLGALSPHHFI